jgi:hypothetical protein
MSQTPKKKWMLYSILFLGVLIASFVWFFKDSGSMYARVQYEDTAFYIPTVINQYSAANIPRINVEIEGKEYLLDLDLGFHGDSILNPSVLSEIKEKTFVHSTFLYGIRGKKYDRDIYKIPKMKIGKITFSNLHISSENEESTNDSVINMQEDDIDPDYVGRLGWKIFRSGSLLLDLGKSTIAVCDNIDTFLKQGFSLKKFTKVPMLEGGEHIEFYAKTPKGVLRCALDTGATLNFLKCENPKNERIEDVIKKKRSLKKFTSFQIENTNFGSIYFHRLPISMPPGIDAILGMDFLTDHVVFIDFKNRQIYFSKK